MNLHRSWLGNASREWHRAAICFALAAAACSVPGVRAANPAPSLSESEVTAEPVPPDVVASAVTAVSRLGDEVVRGRYEAAIERMNPQWKERTARRMGGMDALKRQLDGVAAQMVQQGVSVISFQPQGKPVTYEVVPGRKTVSEAGQQVEKLVHTKWMILVPTVTRFRMIEPGNPKPIIIESTSYQVAVSDKGKNDWTFIDGAGLSVADLRGLYGTLPQDMELPPVSKKEVR